MKTNVKVITGLKDWSRDNDKKIPRDTAAARTMNGSVAAEMGFYIDEKGYYHTSGTVGVGWLKNYQGKAVTDSKTGERLAVMIRPRYELSPWEMLIKVMNDPEYELYISGTNGGFFEIHTNEELIPVKNTEKGGELLAAISFVKECEKICRKHLRQEMSFEEANFNGRVVGNIQVSRHIKANISQAREDRIYCRYPIFTVDTLENRIMKAGLKKAQKVFRQNGITIREMGRIYSYCDNALKAVRTVPIVKSDFGKVNVTGFNSCYKNVIEMAKTVLFNTGTNDLCGNLSDEIKYVMPYTMNMEALFEFYVRASIKEQLKQISDSDIILDEYRIPKKNPLLTLKNADQKAYLMNSYVPDIALIDTSKGERQYIAVFDVKYQNSASAVYAETRRHNSHQLLFYTLLLNVRRCGFIFPKKNSTDDFSNLDIYELNTQAGDAGDESAREYSQCFVDTENHIHRDFSEKLLRYIKGISQSKIIAEEQPD